MSGRNDNLLHRLMPIGLALVSIRHAAYGDLSAPSPDCIANFIAATVPIYEYSPNGENSARVMLRAELKGGMFRRNGTELYFLDARRARSTLAVDANDVGCIVEMLKDPGTAMRIKSRWTRARSKQLRARSADLTHQALQLLRRASTFAEGCNLPAAAPAVGTSVR